MNYANTTGGSAVAGVASMEKHLHLARAVRNLNQFADRLSQLRDRITQEPRPTDSDVADKLTRDPGLSQVLDYTPAEINNIVDRMQHELESITVLLYGG